MKTPGINHDEVLCRLKQHVKFFKQPHQIGDVTTIEDDPYLIIGIETIEVDYMGSGMSIVFTAQKLSTTDYVDHSTSYSDIQFQGFYLEFDLRKDDINQKIRTCMPGVTHSKGGKRYKIMEIVGVKIENFNLIVDFTMKRLHPISRKEAKAKLIHERKKKLNIEVL